MRRDDGEPSAHTRSGCPEFPSPPKGAVQVRPACAARSWAQTGRRAAPWSGDRQVVLVSAISSLSYR
jgi:hypothetical protein